MRTEDLTLRTSTHRASASWTPDEITDALIAHASDELNRGVSDRRIRQRLEQAGATYDLVDEVMRAAARTTRIYERREAIQWIVFGLVCLTAGGVTIAYGYGAAGASTVTVASLLLVGVGYTVKGLLLRRRSRAPSPQPGRPALGPRPTGSPSHTRRAAS